MTIHVIDRNVVLRFLLTDHEQPDVRQGALEAEGLALPMAHAKTSQLRAILSQNAYAARLSTLSYECRR
jgi:hypothetical protein